MNVLKITRTSLPPLAYVRTQASASHKGNACRGGIFCPGFMGCMTGQKAVNCEEYFKRKGLGFVRFDYTDIGVSTDPKIPPKYSFKQWKDDVATVMDQLTEGPQIVIGSSMGGWLSLLTALEKPERVAGVVLVAPSVDFFPKYRHVIPKEMYDNFEKGEVIFVNGPYGQFPVHKGFFTESKPLELLNNEKIAIQCPVRILHSVDDIYAPYEVSLKLLKKLTSTDVEVHLIKNSDHRMSSDNDINLLNAQLDSIFNSIVSKL